MKTMKELGKTFAAERRVAKPVITTSGSKLVNKMAENSAKGRTENGAETFTSTGSYLLDFFAMAGATRNNPTRGLELFKRAMLEDRIAAVRLMFYMRDIRGGQGERRLFRDCLHFLGDEYPEIFKQIVGFVPEYGRWDDIFINDEACMKLIKSQLETDRVAKNPSLLAKWLPTITASSPNTKAAAILMRKALGMKEIEYRKVVRDIRKRIKTVEELMSANKWAEIDYSKVPSCANMKHSKAFFRHDTERYAQFIEDAKTGKVKINSGTLYPYEIFSKMYQGHTIKDDPAMEALWNQLPDNTDGRNAIVVADTSGSMGGLGGGKAMPMAVSVSLALYLAERNTGIFKDCFISFSEKPKLHQIKGRTLAEKMKSIMLGDVANTNLQAVFDLILSSAVESKADVSDMPSVIYIISDMEFDAAVSRHGSSTNFKVVKKKYEAAGYPMPNMVFWNVDSRNDNVPVRMNEHNVALVSGCSTTTFRNAMENKSPYEVMVDVINSERYSCINF